MTRAETSSSTVRGDPGGQARAMAAIGSGEMVVTGCLPLAERLNVVLERMSDYFPPKK